MVNKFPLKHLLLYSKGWYKKFNPNGKNKTIWDDMKAVFTADGYDGEHMTKVHIISVLLNRCQKLKDVRGFELLQFADGISDQNCWQVGYYVKGNKWQPSDEEYDYYTAILYYCLSVLRFIEPSNYDQLPMPDYKNCLPRKNGITDKDLNKFFGK
jgi:hypothetical protein